MKTFHEIPGQVSRDYRALVLSILFHGVIAAIILFFPNFGKSERIVIPSLDITLYDAPPGESPSGNPDTARSEPEKKAEPPSEKPKSKDLMDPSEEEIRKMKKRADDWTPSAKKSKTAKDGFEDDFPINRPGVPGGKASGSMALDTAQFPYMYYLIMMKNRIGENWIPAFGAINPNEPKRTVIYFIVDRSGVVLKSEVEESSGDDTLDQSALRAVNVSSPFPPLPEGFPESSLGVHFGFRFEL